MRQPNRRYHLFVALIGSVLCLGTWMVAQNSTALGQSAPAGSTASQPTAPAQNRLITNLAKNDFTVFEDGKPQRITSFRNEDIPVAMGIVIDNSGSMREKRPAVNAAAINLVQSSNPQDQVFIVNFNDEYFLDQDYTAKIPKLKDALERIESRGGTALYDAVIASAHHLKSS